MSRTSKDHIAPLDLARFLDEEMTTDEREAVELHLQHCQQCGDLLEETGSRLENIGAILRPLRPGEAATDRASNQLHDRLRQIEDSPRYSETWFTPTAIRRYAAFAALLLAVVLVGAAIFYRSAHRTHVAVTPLPDHALTPGAVREVALEEICQEPDDSNDLDPVVSVPMQKVVFRAYGIPPEESKVNFQMDYLINPQLGGVNDIRNLWPQPYGSEWNASAKDALERHLHQMVCEHKIGLADAQREIAENWIDAYKKYFHTSKPI